MLANVTLIQNTFLQSMVTRAGFVGTTARARQHWLVMCQFITEINENSKLVLTTLQDLLLSGDHRLLYQYIVKDDFQPNWHKCTMCGKSGKDRGNLRKHVENIHFPGTFNYQCKYCFENFSTRNSLNIHISKDCQQKQISPLFSLIDGYMTRFGQSAL